MPGQPELQPWGPGARRALHRWTVQQQGPQAQLQPQPELPERVLLRERLPTEPPERGLQPELQPWVPEPWELPGQAQGPDG